MVPNGRREMDNSEPSSEMSRNMKKLTMCAIWFGTFACGLSYNFLPSVLIELKNKFGTTIDDISKVFTVLLLAYLAGALACGVLLNYVNRQATVVCLFYMMVVGVVLIPYAPSKLLFFVAAGILGFTVGGYDTSQVVWTLELWHGEAGIYIQAEYFVFALGAFISPIVTKPFLQQEHVTALNDSNHSATSNETTTQVETNEDKSLLHIPALMFGGTALAAATIMLLLFIFKRYRQPVQSKTSSSESTSPNEESENWRWWVLIILCAALLGCYQGMEYCTIQFMPTFSHYIDLELSEPDGAALLSGLTGALTIGRFLGILACVFKAKPEGILVGNLICALVGNVLLLMWANESLMALWVGSILLGLGYSTVFACVYDYIEAHLKVTNIVSSVMVVSGSTVGAIYPIFVGNSVEHSPFVLMDTIFLSLAVCTVAFCGIYFVTRAKHQKAVTTEKK